MNMYIGNLSYRVKEADLRQVMEEYGTVDSVKLIIDRETRKSKGFAFVEMPNDDEAKNVISELNGAEYEGRHKIKKGYPVKSILFLYLPERGYNALV